MPDFNMKKKVYVDNFTEEQVALAMRELHDWGQRLPRSKESIIQFADVVQGNLSVVDPTL